MNLVILNNDCKVGTISDLISIRNPDGSPNYIPVTSLANGAICSKRYETRFTSTCILESSENYLLILENQGALPLYVKSVIKKSNGSYDVSGSIESSTSIFN